MVFKNMMNTDDRLTDQEKKIMIEAALNEKTEAVNHPDHYNQGGIEVIDVMKAYSTKEQFEGFLYNNVVKYILRANFKGKKKEDLNKALFYLNKLISTLK